MNSRIIRAWLLAILLIPGIVFVGGAVSTNELSSSVGAQTVTEPKPKPGLIRSAFRKGRWAFRRTWDGTRWITKRVWVGTKSTSSKALKGTQSVGRMAIRAIY